MSTICYNCFTERDGGKVCLNCGYENNSASAKYPLALPEGAVLAGQYLVGRVLGQGGFGITYLALDQNSGDKVAIKEYFPETLSLRERGVTTVSLLSDEKREDFAYGSEKFIEEARTLSTLSTVRGITQILGYFEENDTSYFAMEYIEGMSFKQYIAQNGGKVTPDDAVAKLTPVMNALTAVHRLGLIHRDVTPDNIFITKDGDVKLLDFGSAQYSLGEKSQTLDAILKPGYAPREQYMRRSRQGPFTDVYSLGACFYASITGVLPSESLERIETDEMLTISEQGIAIDQNVENAIMTALAVNAQDRFQTMEDFKAAVVGEVTVTAPVRTETQASAPRYSARNSAAATQSAKRPGKVLIAAIVGGVAVLAVVIVLVVTLPKGGGTAVQDTTETPTLAEASESVTPGEPDETVKEAQPQVLVSVAGSEYDALTTTKLVIPENVELTDEDLVNIGKLAELTQLYLYPTNLSDVSFISGLKKLENIGFQHYVTELEPLSDLKNLKTLEMWGDSANNITIVDISCISNLTEMTEISLYNISIKDLSPLKNMTKLTRFEANLIADTDLSALLPLKELTYLRLSNSVSGAAITDLSPLEDKVKLETLQFFCTVSADFTPLANLTNLKNLFVMITKDVVQDINFVSGLTKLTNLYLDLFESAGRTPIDLEPLRNLTELTELYIRRTVNSIEPLAGLTKLTSLTLISVGYGGYDTLTNDDVKQLSKLTKLVSLTFTYHDQISDISALANLPNLKFVDLTNCPITDWSPVDHVATVIGRP